jgi:hypothetical protein
MQRLDIKALIALVDEDELYDALNDEHTYFWYGYFRGAGDHPGDAEFTRFKCKGNALEYLIFNDDTFARYFYANLGYKICDKITEDIYEDYLKYKNGNKDDCLYKRFDEQDIFEDFCYIDDMDKDQQINNIGDDILDDITSYAEYVWKYISTFTISQLDNNFEGETVIHLLDNKMKHILPFGHDQTFTKLKQWGFNQNNT